jgi:hypothetical protein
MTSAAVARPFLAMADLAWTYAMGIAYGPEGVVDDCLETEATPCNPPNGWRKGFEGRRRVHLPACPQGIQNWRRDGFTVASEGNGRSS